MKFLSSESADILDRGIEVVPIVKTYFFRVEKFSGIIMECMRYGF